MSMPTVPHVHPSHKVSLLDLLDRPIAFHRIFVELTGSVTAAVMLSQAFYWSRRTKDPSGWFWKTQDEWEEETGLKRGEQEAARKRLKATGFWAEERRGLPARMFFRVDLDLLADQLLGHQEPTWQPSSEPPLHRCALKPTLLRSHDLKEQQLWWRRGVGHATLR